MRATIAFLAVALSALSSAQLTAGEQKGLADLMTIGNLTARDLEHSPLRPGDVDCLPFVDAAVSKPLQAAGDILDLHQRAGTTTATGLLELMRRVGFGDTLSPQAPSRSSVALPRSIPGSIAQPVGDLVQSVAEANETIRQALSRLSASEKRTLIDGLPQFAVQDPAVKFAFVKQPQADPAILLALLGKVDLPAIRLASVKLTADVQAAVRQLKSAAASTVVNETIKAQVAGVNLEISGTGDDVHDTTNSMLCIDLGGHNRYTGRYAAGVGYASVLIDLGDPQVDVDDLSVGAGLLGVGVAYFGPSNGDFRGGSLCFGAGLAGVGVFLKESGSDTYRAESLCEGFGEFGIGLLIDNGGDKKYDDVCLGQGAGRTQGFGWLINRAKRATFVSGGLQGRSDSQGFGSGYPELPNGLSGGIGMVTQLGGKAIFQGESGCQASSYWRALGSVATTGDGSSFAAGGEAQSFTKSQSSAYLYLIGARNTLVSKGASLATAIDRSSSFLLARGGGDVFAAKDSRPGTGIGGAFGLFLESGPDNRYLDAPADAFDRGEGLFADLGGSSFYGSALGDGQISVAREGAIAFAGEGKAEPSAAPKLRPGSVPMPSGAPMEALYAAAVRGERPAVVQLTQIGKPALDWMLATKLRFATGPAVHLIAGLAGALGDDGAKALVAKIASSDESESRNALEAAASIQAAGAGAYVAEALKKPAMERVAARAAGLLKATSLTSALMPLCLSQDPETALDAVLSLSEIGDSGTVSTGQALLTSPSLAIRHAAEDLIAKYPDQAIAVAKTLLQHYEETPRRTAAELLGKVGTPEALDLIVTLLADPKPGVKIQAMLALDGRCPANSRPTLLDLRNNSDPLVRGVASRIDPGR